MQSNYPFKPRGIVKWHAFSALIDGEDQKNDVIDIPDLSLDLTNNQLSLMNYNLSYALAMNCEVNIEYIHNNKKNNVSGYIKKVDDIKQTILIDDLIIKVSAISDISIEEGFNE